MIPIGIVNGAGRTRLKTEYFDTATHKCVAVHERGDIPPIIMARRVGSAMESYMVIDGNKQMFYLNYFEAMDYMKRHGYKDND